MKITLTEDGNFDKKNLSALQEWFHASCPANFFCSYFKVKTFETNLAL